MNNISQLLQQIDDKKQLISRHHPLAQQQIQNLKEYFKIGLTYASNTLEGNALLSLTTMQSENIDLSSRYLSLTWVESGAIARFS